MIQEPVPLVLKVLMPPGGPFSLPSHSNTCLAAGTPQSQHLFPVQKEPLHLVSLGGHQSWRDKRAMWRGMWLCWCFSSSQTLLQVWLVRGRGLQLRCGGCYTTEVGVRLYVFDIAKWIWESVVFHLLQMNSEFLPLLFDYLWDCYHLTALQSHLGIPSIEQDLLCTNLTEKEIAPWIHNLNLLY